MSASGQRDRNLKWLLLLAASVAAPDAAAAGEDCELHVWAATATGANNGGLLSNLGMAGALADYERNKDANLRDQVSLIEGLTPVTQARLLADADLPELLGMRGARIIFENASSLSRSGADARARRSDSAADCYAELTVDRNFYQKSAVHGRTLATRFTFRDFRSGLKEARVISVQVRNPLAGFPPKRAEDLERARQGLADAFAANVHGFAKRLSR